MFSFFDLYRQLDRHKDASDKADDINHYLNSASDQDKYWLIWLLTGNRPGRVYSIGQLREIALEVSGINEWLFHSCEEAVGDEAETIALIVPFSKIRKPYDLSGLMECLFHFSKLNREDRKSLLINTWMFMDAYERFVFNKLLCGGFRKRIPLRNLCTIFSSQTGVEAWRLYLRFRQKWSPLSGDLKTLIYTEVPGERDAVPYPQMQEKLLREIDLKQSDRSDWHCIPVWNGLRLQVVKRNGKLFLWKDNEEVVNDIFPDIVEAFETMPDGSVVEGELIACRNGSVLPLPAEKLSALSKLNKPGTVEVPVHHFLLTDLLEFKGQDIRRQALSARLELLSSFVKPTALGRLSLACPLLFESWELFQLKSARLLITGVNTFLFRYPEFSRMEGDIDFIYKISSPTQKLRAVLIYVDTSGNDNASNKVRLTFAVWKSEQLIPVAKTNYGALSEENIRLLSEFVKSNTIEKFGPVRSLSPELLFELSYERVESSKRHKSGVSLSSVVLLRWLQGEDVRTAGKLDELYSNIQL